MAGLETQQLRVGDHVAVVTRVVRVVHVSVDHRAVARLLAQRTGERVSERTSEPLWYTDKYLFTLVLG